MRKINAPLPFALLAGAGAMALLSAACTAGGPVGPESAGAEPARAAASASLLESSTPANGAKLRRAPQRLILNFARPVVLAEAVVMGADGMAMPMMLSPAGATRRYELPLDRLGTGVYAVRWRATDEAGAQHQGSINFLVG
jgi:copper transport protein